MPQDTERTISEKPRGILVSEELYRKVKAECAIRGIQVKQAAREAFDMWLSAAPLEDRGEE